ncbi:MAG TPA: ROK family protein, partial [Terrimesophilobacter sp.]|nr:ROK family protein [Terrimesophilobacter sp.]
MATAVGIDIGGTGIKGALVDTVSGELLTERFKLPTPTGSSPRFILDTVNELFGMLGEVAADTPVGVAFPAIILGGRTMSAFNVPKEWIGLEAEAMFEQTLGRDIHFVNDADAAGVAEAHFGAAKGRPGLVFLATLGTGIGTALLYDGKLIPNSEMGHIEIGGVDAETVTSARARERLGLSWEEWATGHLQAYLEQIQLLLNPDIIILGGGGSKAFDEFAGYLSLRTPVVPATLRNNAGIIGAAHLARNDHRARPS